MFEKSGSSCFSYLVQSGYSAIELSENEIDALRTKSIVKGSFKIVVLGFYSTDPDVTSSVMDKTHVISTEPMEDGEFLIIASYRETTGNTHYDTSIEESTQHALVRTIGKAKSILDNYINCPANVDRDEAVRVIREFVNRFGKYTEMANDKKFIDEYKFLLSLASYSLAATASMHNLSALHSRLRRSINSMSGDSFNKNQLKEGIDEMHQMVDLSWSLKPKEFENYSGCEGNEVARTIVRVTKNITHKEVVVSDNITPSSEINPRHTYHNNLIYCFQIIFDNAVYWSKDRVAVKLLDIEEDGSNYNKALVISNDGEPISQSDISKLFTKTTSKRVHGGNGVGLFIAKMLSNQSGFELSYDQDNDFSDETAFVIKWKSRG